MLRIMLLAPLHLQHQQQAQLLREAPQLLLLLVLLLLVMLLLPLLVLLLLSMLFSWSPLLHMALLNTAALLLECHHGLPHLHQIILPQQLLLWAMAMVHAYLQVLVRL
jgi:hypothetical protein